ncbi:hypothetical protein EPA93_28490 [Ktedonosporobacter rubrisoli]|uniref:Uncharacterized protein n=1 Tax=Ktedonosporobacter rubrisoli TaxID=2509675 RepID=A0A4P6JWB8_KTERU|nr:hypothetical protein [Ktedonosporobacter rubrisoli]QBD79703.1 hypothetical protein EPA93_28490 [Ktedonosporobacter rubrisoli]
MANSDPKQVIMEHLNALKFSAQKDVDSNTPAQKPETTEKVGPTNIRFLKARSLANRQLHLVSCEAPDGLELYFTYYLIKDENACWQVYDAIGGPAYETSRETYSQPRALLSRAGWPDHFYASGYIIENGVDVSLLRCIAANGTIMEDEPSEDRFVLLFSEQPVRLPLRIELYNQADNLVGSHEVFKGAL